MAEISHNFVSVIFRKIPDDETLREERKKGGGQLKKSEEENNRRRKIVFAKHVLASRLRNNLQQKQHSSATIAAILGLATHFFTTASKRNKEFASFALVGAQQMMGHCAVRSATSRAAVTNLPRHS